MLLFWGWTASSVHLQLVLVSHTNFDLVLSSSLSLGGSSVATAPLLLLQVGGEEGRSNSASETKEGSSNRNEGESDGRGSETVQRKVVSE